MKDVAVIILNWNGKELLESFLPSVVEHTPGELADIIVADNGSTDGSRQLLAESFPEVKVIEFETNLGFAEGYNRAIEATGCRFTVLLNSDVEVRGDWLTPLWRYMTTTPVAGACQPKILSLRSPGKFEYAGAAGGFLDRNGYPYCRGRIFDTIEDDLGQYDDISEIFWASGACLMVDTGLYKMVGGLDPSFFAHMEEIDLCWRLHLAGKSIAVVPESRVYHFGGASLDAADPKKTYLNFRNSLFMLYKNLPKGWGRWWKIFLRRILDTAAIMKFVAEGNSSHALAVIKAHIHYMTRRNSIAQNVITPKQNLLKGKRNILLQYYLNKRRKFSDLK